MKCYLPATKSVGLCFAAVLATTLFVGCKPPPGEGAQRMRIDGSSTVYPVMEGVAESFREQHGNPPTIGISGTGGGFKKFARGETDISNASRPVLTSELEAMKANNIEFVELPICFDALTVVVHPENTWVDHLTVEELKKIWEPEASGKITRWNQIRSEWPDEPLMLFGPGADSGTFDYFTEAIVGKAKSSRGDFTASEDDNVLVLGVAGNKYALGYMAYAYVHGNLQRLRPVAIDWEKDTLGPVEPTLDNVLAGTYNPLSRPLFIYVSRDSAERPDVQKFVEFMIDNAADICTKVGYLPLPTEAYPKVKEHFQARKLGSVFGGVPEVGVTIDEVLTRETK